MERFLDIQEEPFEEFTKTGRKKKKPKIGKFYGGNELRSGLVDIALFQSLTKRSDLPDLLKEYGMVIVDEAHHVAAKTFEDVVRQVNSRYIYGLTATPKRDDGLENILYMRLGEVRYEAKKLIPGNIAQKLFLRFTSLGEHLADADSQSIHDNYEMMMEAEDRNQQIVEDIVLNLKERRHLIVLSRYVNHLNVLKESLDEANISAPVYILNSKMKAKDLRFELASLKQEGKPFVLLTTGSYAGEGFDLPALDTLLLAMPISGNTSMHQYLGRLLRNLDEKEELRVYDYVDYAIPMIYRMYQKRLRIYKKMGYSLFEDELTELYRSNIFGSEYGSVLVKDLESVKVSFVLILPILSKKIFDILTSLACSESVDRVLILPHPDFAEKKFLAKYLEETQLLSSMGYRVLFKKKVQQSFAVIDSKIVWMMPDNYVLTEDAVALRMYSEDIAERLARHYLK